MLKYYQAAKDLVWEFGGTLDKFIGDSVLAIFGYPFPGDSTSSVESAIHYSSALIDTGNSILKELEKRQSDVIPTGTRVGIASGAITVVGLGKEPETLEIGFIGTTINRSARLEGACKLDWADAPEGDNINGAMIDVESINLLESNNPTFKNRLLQGQNEPILIPKEKAKGLFNDINAWRLEPRKLKSNWSLYRASKAEFDESFTEDFSDWPEESHIEIPEDNGKKNKEE